MSDDLRTAAEGAVAKAALPVLTVSASVGGWGVAEWMYTATIFYIVLQIGYLLWKWRHERRTMLEARAAFRAKMELPPE